MPPQNAQPPSPAPGQFDFMMKDQPKPPGRIRSLLPDIPRLAKIVLAALGSLIVLVILYSVLFGGKITNTDQLTSVMATAQEIARVSALAQTGSQNTDTQGLAATTGKVLASQEQQLKSYLKTNKIKVNFKKLAAKLDKNTDAQLLAAQQNNNYDQTYYDYLKTNLATYQSMLNFTSLTASKNGKAILKTAFDSVQTLLSAPQLK